MSQAFPIAADERYAISTAVAAQTDFTIPFPFQAAADIAVYRRTGAGDAPLTLGDDYTVVGENDPGGGTLTLTEESEGTGEKILIVAKAVLERLTAITQGGKFSSLLIEKDLDRLTLITQELARDIGRGFKVDYGATPGKVTPGASGRLAIWAADGGLVEGMPSEAFGGAAWEIAFAPAGTVVAVTVQAAIEELDADLAAAIAASDAGLAALAAADALKLPKAGGTMTGPIGFTHQASPANPAAGVLAVFAKSDNRLYTRNSEGVEDSVGSGGVQIAADRTALLAINVALYTTAFLTEAGREGTFRWNGADLSGTLLGTAITSTAVDSSTETITKASHGLKTGMAVVTTTAVNGLALNTIYYAIRTDADNFKLASSFADAIAGTAFDLTGDTAVTVKRHYDPAQGVYVCPTAALDGSSGAWVRVYEGAVSPFWFGATGAGDGTEVGSPDDGPALQACFFFGADVDLGSPPSGYFKTENQLVMTEREQHVVGHGLFGDCTIVAGGAMTSVIRMDNQWQTLEGFSVAGGFDSSAKVATHCIQLYSAARATVRHMDIIYAVENGIDFDAEALTPASNNIGCLIDHNHIRINGQDGIHMPRLPTTTQGDNGNVSLIMNNFITSNVRHGIYLDTMGVSIVANNIETNGTGGTGYGVYIEPTDTASTRKVFPTLNGNWLEGTSGRDIYPSSDYDVQTGYLEARTLNSAPIKGNVTINNCLRVADETGGASLTLASLGGLTHFCDVFRISSAPTATGTLARTAAANPSDYGGSPYYAELSVSAWGASSFEFGQRLDDVRTLAGLPGVFSMFAQSPSDTSITLTVTQNFGSGGSASVTVYNDTIQLDATLGLCFVNFAVPSVDGKTFGTDSYLEWKLVFATSKATGTYRMGAFDLRPGFTPPASAEISALAEDLRRVKSYFHESGTQRWQGDATSARNYAINITLPVPMRKTPTLSFTSVGATSFASGAPTMQDSDKASFTATNAANATAAGNFRFTYKADARL